MRLALENAVSVAGVLLLTDATMTNVAEEKSAAGATNMEGIYVTQQPLAPRRIGRGTLHASRSREEW